MTQRSYPFDSTGIANETDWANLARLWYPTGVIQGDLNNFANNAPSGLSVGIQSGRSYMDGVWHESNATETRSVATNAANGSARVDRIALKLDRTANTVDIVVAAGTPGAGAPALTNTATVVYSKLYLANLNANATSITSITDERAYANRPVWLNVGGSGLPGFENSWQNFKAGYAPVGF